MPVINPFVPGSPVVPEYFRGRRSEIHQCTAALINSSHGHPQSVLLRGNRGIGKTSLARALCHLLTNQLIESIEAPYVCIYTLVRNDATLRQLVSQMLTDCRKVGGQHKLNRFVRWIDRRLETIGAGNMTFRLRDPTLNDENDYAGELLAAYGALGEELAKRSPVPNLLVVLDELEQCRELEQFAGIYRAVDERLSLSNIGNMSFLLVGLNDVVDRLRVGHPSVTRTLTHVELPLLPQEERVQVFSEILKSSAPPIEATAEAVQLAAFASEGYPQYLQEIGYAMVEVDTDGRLDGNDVIGALRGTEHYPGVIKQLGLKYFDPIYLRQIQNDRARRILTAIAMDDLDWVPRSQIAGRIGVRPEALSHHLSTLVDANIIQKDGTRQGYYGLPSFMFKMYLRMFDSIERNDPYIQLRLKLEGID